MRIGAAIKPEIELDIERLLLAGSRLSPLSWGGSDIPEKQALLRGCFRLRFQLVDATPNL